MKACVLVVFFLAIPHVLIADHNHIRPLDPWAEQALRLGLERSPLMRELVDRLQGSDVIVHIETRTQLPAGAVGTTRLAAATASSRYVRIVLYRDPLPVYQVAVLGHELQHACEIADAHVTDASGMRALFNSIGWRSDTGAYETKAARRAGEIVWFEVQGDEKRAAAKRRAALRD